jgi:hypothetical protein
LQGVLDVKWSLDRTDRSGSCLSSLSEFSVAVMMDGAYVMVGLQGAAREEV